MSGGDNTVNPDDPIYDGEDIFSDGTLLGGRVTYRQFRAGYRTGIEPVLMAAFVPAEPGDTILEAGCGAGAGLLCLNARLEKIQGVGLEFDPQTAMLAAENFRANKAASLIVLQTRVPEMPKTLRDLTNSPNGRFRHSMANPPWHRHDSPPSPDRRRSLALSQPPEGWQRWIATLARWTLPGGTITLALPAAATDEACVALREAGCGSIVLLPLWPKAGRAAKLVLVRATVGGRGAFMLAPGLILHQDNGVFTPHAESVLRRMACLTPDGPVVTES